MSEKEREAEAYRHRSRTPGQQDLPTAETEHRDVASGDDQERNELTPDRRGRPGFGPTTHDDTRWAEKDESEDR